MGGYERDMQDLTLEQAVARNKIIAKYEADCKKLREDPSLLDRLAAENAELKLRYLHVAELNHSQVSMVRADCAELAAANATLDALREAVPVNACDVVSYDASDYFHYLFDAIWILYPQPPETTDEPR